MKIKSAKRYGQKYRGRTLIKPVLLKLDDLAGKQSMPKYS